MRTTGKVAVFYHKADNDGMMSGVIAENYLIPRSESVDLIPIDYGEDFEAAMPHPPSDYEFIYLIDVSDMKFMTNHGSKIIYIDHHKNAMDSMPKVFDRHCIDGVAACRLAFDYLTQAPNHVWHDKEYFVTRQNSLEPLCVAMIGEYDIWDKTSLLAEKLNFGLDVNFNSCKYFFNQTKGILVCNKSDDVHVIAPDSDILGSCRDVGFFLYLINKGEGVLNYIKQTGDRVKPTPFTLNGLRGVYFNTHIKSSLIYQLKDDEDFIMVWNYTKDVVKASFYSNKIDASELARMFNGNGHRGAAGCRMSLGMLLDTIKPQM